MDLTSTVFFGSTGIAALLDTVVHAQDRAAVVVVLAGHRAVLRPLQLTAEDRHLRIQPAVAVALAARGPGATPSLH